MLISKGKEEKQYSTSEEKPSLEFTPQRPSIYAVHTKKII